ncbi:SGNH/GDSL hydrolase family protein OS=Streptomyces cyaneofuscatus OX=66883 GN=G3I52_18395 PE=4 SV=1 [Streptomyces cyaneofuscatus]
MSVRRFWASLSTLALTAVAALGVAGTAVAADSAAAGGYVALGDSYSSGVGAGDYLPDSGDCRRSANAYPQLWAAANSPTSFAFVAWNSCAAPSQDGNDLAGQLSPRTSRVMRHAGLHGARHPPCLPDFVPSPRLSEDRQ